MKKFVALTATASVMVLAAPASAQLLQYTISGVDTNGAVEFASFQINANPIPNVVVAGQGFQINAVPGTFTYGSNSAPSPQNISFYTTAFQGGLFVGTGSLLAYDGPQLYTGTESMPHLLTGRFVITDYYSGAPISLLVVPVATGVPELASWAMMIVGLGLAGCALRARRTAVKFQNA